MITHEQIRAYGKKFFGEGFEYRAEQTEVLTDNDPYPFPVGAFRNVNVNAIVMI